MTIPIVEVGSICAVMRARNVELFEVLGGWARTTADPELQRRFATACHRHAWHAELWDQRTPRFVGADFTVATVPTSPALAGDADRRDWYRQQLADIGEQLAQLESACDPDLDPSTARTLQLVTADLAHL